MKAPRLRLVVVDDHALFRRGLVGLLKDMLEFEVVGEAEEEAGGAAGEGSWEWSAEAGGSEGTERGGGEVAG